MPKKCSSCTFFSPENDPQQCPECGAALQFTMFAPDGYVPPDQPAADGTAAASTGAAAMTTPGTNGPAWDVDSAAYEIMELPLSVRLGQIGTGILVVFMLARFGRAVTFFVLFSGSSTPPGAFVLVVAGLATLLVYVGSAIAGGAVAGAMSVNWVPQGLGVGLGVLAFPLFLLVLFVPSWIPILLYLGLIAITTVFTIFGAWLGHKVVRPSRFIVG